MAMVEEKMESYKWRKVISVSQWEAPTFVAFMAAYCWLLSSRESIKQSLVTTTPAACLVGFPGSLKGFFATAFCSTGSSLPSGARICQFGWVYFCFRVEFAILW